MTTALPRIEYIEARRVLLDALDAAGRENLDLAHVARYDDKEDAGAATEVELLVALGLTKGSVVVDLGAGTGQFTMAVASHCARVVAVDISAPMLDQLPGKVDKAGLTNVEISRAGFLSYEHQGTPADFVYSRWALHHLPDFWKVVALDRMRQFMPPGGVLRLSDIVYSFDAAEAPIRIEHSTFTCLLEPMIERSGFEIESAEYSANGVYADYVARAI